MSARRVDRCGICGSARLDLVLSLGASPPTCVMAPVGRREATENHHPLELLRCHDCSLVQLSVVIDPRVAFPPDYPYSSGNSRMLHDNFEDLARQASGWLGGLCADDLVVDIGANDGTLLSKFVDCKTVGVEPTWQSLKGDADAVWEMFFSESVAREIVAEYGQAKVVTACNVLAHVDDIADVMRGIGHLLADDGILIAENHDLASVVDGQWDTVYHEHLRFYDPHSFNALLEAYGFGCREWQRIPTHGGSFRMLAQRGVHVDPSPRNYDFEPVASAARAARASLRRLPARMAGIGATARATTIINYAGLDVEDIAYVCEVPGSDKIGHYIPGTRIPVVDEAQLFEDQHDAVLFSWHLLEGIVPKLRERGWTGEIYMPTAPTLQTA